MMLSLLRLKKAVVENPILLVILAAAFGLRLYGIYFDYPNGINNIWDEIFSVSWLLDVADQKTLFTAVPYQYPLLLPIMYLPGLAIRLLYLAMRHNDFTVDALKQSLILGGMGQLFIVIRWYSVLFGTAAAYFIYDIFARVFKRHSSGLVAAAAYAVAFVPVFMAHWGKTHTIMVFFVLVSVWAAVRFEGEKKNRWAYVCAAAAAGAFCIHYIGVFATIIPACLWLWNRQSIDKKTALKALLLGIAICAFFYGLNFYGFLGMWGNNVGYIQGGGLSGMGHAGAFERFYYLFRDTFNLDPILLAAGVVTLIFGGLGLYRNKAGRYVLAALFGNWFLMSTLIAWPQMSRWLLPFSSLLLPLGAAWLWSWVMEHKFSRGWQLAIIIVLLLPSLYLDLRWLNLLRTNTRMQAENWIMHNLVGSNVYTFDMYFDAPLSYEAAVWHLENNNRGASKKLSYVADHPEQFSGKGINLYYDYGYSRYENLAGASTTQIIVSYWKDKNPAGILPSGPSREDEQSIINEVSRYHSLKLIKTFYPTDDENVIKFGTDDFLNNPLSWQTLLKLRTSGPFVEIYQVDPLTD